MLANPINPTISQSSLVASSNPKEDNTQYNTHTVDITHVTVEIHLTNFKVHDTFPLNLSANFKKKGVKYFLFEESIPAIVQTIFDGGYLSHGEVDRACRLPDHLLGRYNRFHGVKLTFRDNHRIVKKYSFIRREVSIQVMDHLSDPDIQKTLVYEIAKYPGMESIVDRFDFGDSNSSSSDEE